MNEIQKTQLEEIAKALVYTLGSIPPHEADKVVAKCVESIYVDLLGKKGKIVKGFSYFADHYDGTGEHRCSYKFMEEKI